MSLLAYPCVPSSSSFVLPFNIPSRVFRLPSLPPHVSSSPYPSFVSNLFSPTRHGVPSTQASQMKARARAEKGEGRGDEAGGSTAEETEGGGGGGARGAAVTAEAVAVAAAVGSGIGERGLPPAGSLGGDFFSLLLKADEFQNTKVSDVAGSFRWAPFLPVTPDDSLLTLLLLVSKYRVRSVPVVEAGQPAVLNLVTQSSVVEVLADCHGLPWFDRLADRPICDLGLPTLPGDKVVVVEDDVPVLEPFRRMLAAGVGGVPVVAKGTRQVVGSISVRDIQLLLVAPQLFHDCRSLTVAQFLEIAKGRGSSTGLISPAATPPTRCRANTPLRRVMHSLQAARVHRVYVTDEVGELQGVVTLRDIIGRFVVEPPDYFGDFFGGVVPDAARMHHVYVTDEVGELQGVVSLRDIIGKFVVEPPDYFGDFFGGVVPDVHPTASAPMWLHADWDIGGGW
ncbi:unnamed protein product [Closterium sp. NIES-53]